MGGARVGDGVGQELGVMTRRQRSGLRRDRIGFVFQAYNLIPVLSALENVEFIMQLRGVAAAEPTPGEPAASRSDRPRDFAVST